MLLTDPVATFNNESMCFLKLIIFATLEIEIEFLLLKKGVLNFTFWGLLLLSFGSFSFFSCSNIRIFSL